MKELLTENLGHFWIILPLVLAGTFADVMGLPGALGFTAGVAFYVGIARGKQS